MRKTLVVGGGPTGCEVALHLVQHGCPVTIVEMLPKIGMALESMTRKVLLGELKAKNVKIMTECRLLRVEENGAVVVAKEGRDFFIEADRVVFAIGSRPDNTLYEKIKTSRYEIHQIGDCLEPRSAKQAIYEGAVLGRSI